MNIIVNSSILHKSLQLLGGVLNSNNSLPILDNFERAIKANETLEDIQAIKEGFSLIHLGLKNGLEKHGLKAIESNGDVFNSDMHEAIAQIPAPSEDLKGKVLDTVEKGYSLNEKVIRYAKVAVGS